MSTRKKKENKKKKINENKNKIDIFENKNGEIEQEIDRQE